MPSFLHNSHVCMLSCKCWNCVIKGWWLVENECKCLAWFPAPYLKNAEAEDEPADEEVGEGKICDRILERILLRTFLIVCIDCEVVHYWHQANF